MTCKSVLCNDDVVCAWVLSVILCNVLPRLVVSVWCLAMEGSKWGVAAVPVWDGVFQP